MFQCPLVARAPRGQGGQAAHAGTFATQGCPQAAPPGWEPLPPYVAFPCFWSQQHPPAALRGHCRCPHGVTPAGGGELSPHAGPRALGRTPTDPGAPTLGGNTPRHPGPGRKRGPSWGSVGMLAVDPISGPGLVSLVACCAVSQALVTYLGIKGCHGLGGTHLCGVSVTSRGYGLCDGHFNT